MFGFNVPFFDCQLNTHDRIYSGTLPGRTAGSSGVHPMTETGKPDTSQDHLKYLDGLRALAALYVVLYHASLQVAPFTHSATVDVFLRLFTLGHYAVGLFIVLSGFCLALPIVRGDGTIRGGAWNFFQRRARRILPSYYLAVAFSLLVIFLFSINHKTGTHWDISVPVTLSSLLTHLFLLQDAFGDPKINHAFWSISVEWRIYFLFPLLVLGWRRLGAVPTTILAIVG
ncbi:MAG: acyltransferase, partial [Alphaproteobacteria bacterium]